MRDSTRDRLLETIEAATRLFLAAGYRRTTMAHVAEALLVSEPAVYRYVESKEALFALVLRQAVEPAYLESVRSLPYPTPAPEETLRFIREMLEAETRIAALAPERNPAGDDARGLAELEEIIGALYDRADRFHLALKLVERSAMDWPELAALWFGEIRPRLLSQLTRYLSGRHEEGLLRVSGHPSISARLILEVVAYFAMHRHTDPRPPDASPETLRAVVLADLAHAFRVDG